MKAAHSKAVAIYELSELGGDHGNFRRTTILERKPSILPL